MSTILARTIDNNYIYADRSDKDGNGNNIASTYATQASVSAIRQVPAAAAADENKVLTVDSSGSPAWVQPSSGTVDQTYNAASTNAQSGTAVAQAISSIPSASYTAGDGIDISNDEISVAYDQNTLDVAAISTTASLSSVMAWALNFSLPSEVAAMIPSLMTGGPSVTMTIPSDILINQRYMEDDAFLMFGTGYNPLVNDSIILKTPLTYSERTEEGISLDGQTVTLPVVDSTNWYIGSDVTTSAQFRSMAIMFGSADGSSVSISLGEGFYATDSTLNPPLTFSQLGAPLLTVLDPLPAHTSADAGRVLQVQNDGSLAWVTLT